MSALNPNKPEEKVESPDWLLKVESAELGAHINVITDGIRSATHNVFRATNHKDVPSGLSHIFYSPGGTGAIEFQDNIELTDIQYGLNQILKQD